jgi:hypothetical protein
MFLVCCLSHTEEVIGATADNSVLILQCLASNWKLLVPVYHLSDFEGIQTQWFTHY